MTKLTRNVLNRVLIAIVVSTAQGAATIVQAEPDSVPSKPKSDPHIKAVAPVSSKKQTAVDYSQGGTSMTGSHLTMPVLRYQGHYYVGSSFTARQIIAVDHSGSSSGVINVDEVSNLPASRSKTAASDKTAQSKQPARPATGKQ